MYKVNAVDRLRKIVTSLVEFKRTDIEKKLEKEEVPSPCLRVIIDNGINCDKYNCCGSNVISCGAKFIDSLYDISKKKFSNNFYNISFDIDCIRKKSLGKENILVECSYIEDDFYESDFLSFPDVQAAECIAIMALSFSLFHEIGHFMNDTQIENDCKQNKRNNVGFEKEFKADDYSFAAVKDFFIDAFKTENDAKKILIGPLVSFLAVLSFTDEGVEKKDKGHPFTILRIKRLFDYFKVSDNDPVWEIAFNELNSWCKSKTWQWNDNIDYKNRFMTMCNYYESIEK